jgi:hypothetical protein
MKSRVVALVLCVSVLALSAVAQTARPKQEKLLFENEYVKVYEVTLAKGDKLPPHDSGNRLIYSLTNYSLKYSWSDRSSVEKRTAGDIHFHPSGVHAEENAGPGKVSFLMIERSGTALPVTTVAGEDMAKMSPSNTRVIFDRDMAKVFEVTLPPRDAVGMHLGLYRVIYGVTGYDLKVKTSDGKEARATGKKGSVRWETPSLHMVENPTDAVAKILVFSFKR